MAPENLASQPERESTRITKLEEQITKLTDKEANEQLKKAFDFAADSTKQVLTLSTGILALTITFSEKMIGTVTGSTRVLLGTAWGLYVVSIVFGLATLLALTGSLAKQKPSIYGSNIRIPSMLQLLSFAVATGCVVWFALSSVLCPFWPFCR